jgi:dienelactone hydrolase
MPDLDFYLKERVKYDVPGMERAVVTKDLVYKNEARTRFNFVADVYRPPEPEGSAPPPAVILVHGEWPPDILPHSKNLGSYVSWGQIIAASGLAAVNFNHRTTERLTKAAAATADIDDLIAYLRSHADVLSIDGDRLCLWSFSAGVPLGMRAAMLPGSDYVRCIVACYGPLDLQRSRASFPAVVSDKTLRDLSALHYLTTTAAQLSPIFVAKGGLDTPRLNESIDRFVEEARSRGIPLEVMEHLQGRHGFDVLDDDARTREIIKRTLDFVKEHI